MFKNPFSFNGRIRRLEYGLSILIYYVFIVLIVFLGGGLGSEDPGAEELGYQSLFVLLIIPALWFILAQSVKRSHDRGNSGWWILIPFYNLILLFLEGEVGENRFGPNPKGIGNYDGINEIGNYLEQA